MTCCNTTIGIKSKHFLNKLLILQYKILIFTKLNKNVICFWLDIPSLERPVFNESEAVELQLGLTLQQIIDVVCTLKIFCLKVFHFLNFIYINVEINFGLKEIPLETELSLSSELKKESELISLFSLLKKFNVLFIFNLNYLPSQA